MPNICMMEFVIRFYLPFFLFGIDKALPPLFPSQMHHIQHDMKIPILQAHQHNQMIAHAPSPTQHSSQHHPQDMHINAVSIAQGSSTEHYISVAQSQSTHLPHVSNLSRHINTR